MTIPPLHRASSASSVTNGMAPPTAAGGSAPVTSRPAASRPGGYSTTFRPVRRDSRPADHDGGERPLMAKGRAETSLSLPCDSSTAGNTPAEGATTVKARRRAVTWASDTGWKTGSRPLLHASDTAAWSSRTTARPRISLGTILRGGTNPIFRPSALEGLKEGSRHGSCAVRDLPHHRRGNGERTARSSARVQFALHGKEQEVVVTRTQEVGKPVRTSAVWSTVLTVVARICFVVCVVSVAL